MNWYITLEAVKTAGGIEGQDRDAAIGRLIEAVSRAVDSATHTRFIPETAVRKYEFNQRNVRSNRLYFDADLFSMTTLTDRGSEQRALTEGAEYLLLPDNAGPPFYAAEILRSQGVSYEGGAQTSQQSFEATGLWSATAETVAASVVAVNSITDAIGTSIHVKDGGKVGVGDTLLIESEQVFISGRDDVDLLVNLSGALTADETDTNVGLSGAPVDPVNVGEVLRIGTERMRVTAVNTTTSFEVERMYDGTTLAAHDNAVDIFMRRTYTMVRGVNGTTAASHADDTVFTRYVAPPLIEEVVLAEVLQLFHRQESGFTQRVGAGESQVTLRPESLKALQKRAYGAHRRNLVESL